MGAEESASPDARLPRLRLDELLDELQTRIDEVRGTRDRLNGLLEAVMSVGRELDLSQVLRTIVEAAVTLVDAEYAERWASSVRTAAGSPSSCPSASRTRCAGGSATCRRGTDCWAS
jgi:hypothetical protein